MFSLYDGPAERSIEFEVTPVKDNVDGGDKSMEVDFSIILNEYIPDWQCHENLTNVRVS